MQYDVNAKAGVIELAKKAAYLCDMKTHALNHRPPAANFRVAIATFVVAFVIASALPVFAASQITAHRAFYELELGDRQQNAFITNVNGRSAFSIERECSGWRSVEDYMIRFIADNGGSDNLLSHFESWESADGDMYSFDILEESSFDGRKDFGGYVQLAKDFSGDAFFSMEPDAALELPSDTLFPVRHIQRLLDTAEKGETILGANLFTGAEPDSAFMRTSTVFGGWRDAPAKNLGDLGEDGYWQINIAYFQPSAKTAEPEYEIQFAMQKNGLVRSYVIDYGDFSISAKLTSVESVDMPECS